MSVSPFLSHIRISVNGFRLSGIFQDHLPASFLQSLFFPIKATFPHDRVVKNPPATEGDEGDVGLIPGGQEDPLEKEMATHSSTLA